MGDVGNAIGALGDPVGIFAFDAHAIEVPFQTVDSSADADSVSEEIAEVASETGEGVVVDFRAVGGGTDAFVGY